MEAKVADRGVAVGGIGVSIDEDWMTGSAETPSLSYNLYRLYV